MPNSSYPNGFPNGISIREVPFDIRQGGSAKTFWVDSESGSNSNKGTFNSQFATIDYAIGRCTADKGDTIYVAAGHSESVIAAGGITADIAGISIIGLGLASNRPTVTFETDAAASIVISADAVRINNLIFVCDITSQVTMIDCNSTRSMIDGNKFMEGAQTGLTFIDINGGGANECDGVQIVGNEFYAPTAGNYNAAIELGEVADGVVIDSNVVWGDFDEACIHNPTGKVLTNLTISNNTLTNSQTGIESIELVSACTGVASRNFMYTDTYATTIDPGSLACFENYSVSTTDKNARLNPVVET